MKTNILLLTLLFSSHFLACYSFKGISIDPDTKTFYVHTFENNAASAPVTLTETATQDLRTKIERESPLSQDDTNADIEFKGKINGFRVSSVAPQRGETTAFNRLEISYSIEYIDNNDEEKNWTKTWNIFSDFPSNQTLLDVQDGLIQIIHEDLVEKIFNEAFTDW